MNKKTQTIIIVTLFAILLILLTSFVIIKSKNNNKNINSEAQEIVTKSYKVTFNDGSNIIETQEVEEGECAKRPEDPQKEGYIFIEWKLDNESYDFSSKVEKDITLDASWSEVPKDKKTFVVSFKTDGGTTIPNQVIEEGGIVTVPNSPTREGYIFKGWNYNGKEYNFTSKVYQDLVLEAKWEKEKASKEKQTNNDKTNNSSSTNNNTNNNNNNSNNSGNNQNNNDQPVVTNEFTVSFVTDGGTTIPSQVVKKGNKASKPNSPSKAGYTFKEWQLNGKTYNFDSPVNSNIVLKAKWEAIDYVLDINTNRNNIEGAISVSNSSILKVTAKYDTTNSVPSTIKGINYSFKGLKEGNASVTFVFNYMFYEHPVMSLAKITFNFTIDKNLTVIEKSRVINFGSKNCSLTSPNAYSCNINEYYTITFDTDGGSNVPETYAYHTPILEYSLPSTPIKSGYTFKEWQLNGKKFDFNTVITKDITLKAVWE